MFHRQFSLLVMAGLQVFGQTHYLRDPKCRIFSHMIKTNDKARRQFSIEKCNLPKLFPPLSPTKSEWGWAPHLTL